MTEVISLKFKEGGRIYYFSPNGIKFQNGDMAVVETANGLSIGTVSKANHTVEDEAISAPLKNCLRKANESDIKKLKENDKLITVSKASKGILIFFGIILLIEIILNIILYFI